MKKTKVEKCIRYLQKLSSTWKSTLLQENVQDFLDGSVVIRIRFLVLLGKTIDYFIFSIL